MNAKPRAFEPRRLLRAVRPHYRALLCVTLLALFGGALVGRLAVPNAELARAAARITREPHAVFGRALQDDVLERARRKAGAELPISLLRAHTKVGFEGRDRLTLELSGGLESELGLAGDDLRELADALVETYVVLANERADQDSFESRRERAGARGQAQAERERADDALRAALAREGLPELTRELARERAELAALEAEAGAASVEANAEQERASALHELAPQGLGQVAPQALAGAQRELSRKLARGAPPAELAALRSRIQRLQAPVPARTAPALQEQAAARAQAVRARGLAQRVTQKRAELARLEAAADRVAPLQSRAELARARALELEVQTLGFSVGSPRSSVLQHAELITVAPHGLRLLVSLLAPLIALLTLAAFYLLHRLPRLRVREATEVAHWLAVPVLTSSAWPARPEALEALVDELADPALDALGTTLFLPLTELERPLAATLVAQLNARAQRHYRSPTGSRVTIAQDWQGELDSSRIQRAAEVADRVLWVVASDVHQGPTLEARRSLVARSRRVAALLVDAETPEPGVPRNVGSVSDYWRRAAGQGVSSS